MATEILSNGDESDNSLPQVYGLLTVIGQPFQKPVGTRGYKKACVECRCSCGTVKTYHLGDLKSGKSQSCGCLKRERSTTHGHTRKSGKPSPTYRSWYNMVTRCTNPNYPRFADYGGRGITVCDRWLRFEGFLEDMGERPKGTTINRKHNNLGYCPENCEWATVKEQANNQRSNRLLTHNGRTQTMAQWAEELGMSYDTLRGRLDKLNWPLEKALATPVKGS